MKSNLKEAQGPLESALSAPADWSIALDREHPVKDGAAACERHGVTLSGSTYEKAHRAARRLDREAYISSGSAKNDRERVSTYTGSLAELRERRGRLLGDGRKTAELDAGISSLEHNIALVQARLDAAGDLSDSQPARRERVDHWRCIRRGLEQEAIQYRGRPMPEDLEARIDEATTNLDAAEAAFEAGRAEPEALLAARSKAEREARHGLATTLRDRVLEKIAASVREAMDATRIALHLRRPKRALPPQVDAALREAERICGIADRLDGECWGLMPFAALLGDDLLATVLPDVEPAELRRLRRRRAELESGMLKNEPLMDEVM
ncbi:MAG TPA: hypothetical protein VGK94_08480 [Candidatus Polarisedimenticolia bacterium]|jgi:hypothetical protein